MALFMVVLAAAGVCLEHPSSPLYTWLTSPWSRRLTMGGVAGITLVGLIYSPWGQRTGAHLNPAVTLAYWQVGKLGARHAISYIVAQCLGAYLGMASAAWVLGDALGHPNVQYVTTQPGRSGILAAFAAEWSLSFLLMTVVRATSLSERWAPRTGLCVGLFVMVAVAIESPMSGMSLNPARSMGAGLWAHDARGLWVYLLAPPLGMLCAAESIRLLVRTLRQITRVPAVLRTWHVRHAPAAAAQVEFEVAASPDRVSSEGASRQN